MVVSFSAVTALGYLALFAALCLIGGIAGIMYVIRTIRQDMEDPYEVWKERKGGKHEK